MWQIKESLKTNPLSKLILFFFFLLGSTLEWGLQHKKISDYRKLNHFEDNYLIYIETIHT